MRFDELVGARKIQPDLEELEAFRRLAIEKRKHFRMNNAFPCREPLHVAGSEACGCAERIRMIDVSVAHDRDRFESTMRMLRKSRNGAAVIHPPAVLAFKVLSDVSSGERRGGPEPLLAFRIHIVVVHAEEEWVGCFPRDTESLDVDNGITHNNLSRLIKGDRTIEIHRRRRFQ